MEKNPGTQVNVERKKEVLDAVRPACERPAQAAIHYLARKWMDARTAIGNLSNNLHEADAKRSFARGVRNCGKVDLVPFALAFVLLSEPPAITASPKDADPIAGHWKLAEGITMDVLPDGQAHGHFPTFDIEGQWTLGPREGSERHYVIKWQGGQYIDSLSLDNTNRHLYGQNNIGWKISGERIEGVAAAPAPQAVMHTAPPTSASGPMLAASPFPAPPAVITTPPAEIETPSAASPSQDASAVSILTSDPEKYVFVNNVVWDVETGQPMSGLKAPKLIAPSFFIQHVNDRLYCANHNTGTVNMPVSGFIYGPDFSPLAPSLSAASEPGNYALQGCWMNADRRRVVWIEQGDFWRGEIDWPGFKIVNRKRVTNTGVFQSWQAPLLWWGQLIFVYGEFDKEKPVVRINLATGATDELNAYLAFTKAPASNSTIHTLCSPTFCRVVNVTQTAIYCYDARTDKTTFIYNQMEQSRGKFSKSTPEADKVVWVDDDIFYTYSMDALVAKVDLRNCRMQLVAGTPLVDGPSQGLRRKVENVVPGGRYLDVVSFKSDHSGNEPFVERYLLELATGHTITLPFTNTDYGQWIDASRYLYNRTTGGLSAVGAWIFDLSTGTNKRVSTMQIDLQRTVLLPRKNEIWAISQQAGNVLLRINISKATTDNLGACGLDTPQILPEDAALDLGFGQAATADLWKPIAVDPAALKPTEPSDPPQGKLIVIEATRQLPLAEREWAENSYDYASSNQTLGNFCDPAKFSEIALAAHQSAPEVTLLNLISKLDLTPALDRERMSHYFYAVARQSAVDSRRFAPHQEGTSLVYSKIQLAEMDQIASRTAAAATAAFLKKPMLDANYIEFIWQPIFRKELGPARH